MIDSTEQEAKVFGLDVESDVPQQGAKLVAAEEALVAFIVFVEDRLLLYICCGFLWFV